MVYTQIQRYTLSCSEIPVVMKKQSQPVLWIAITKEVISKPKQPSCKKDVVPKETMVQNQNGGQEMAVMEG